MALLVQLCVLLAAVSACVAQMDYSYPTLWNPATLVNSTVSYKDGSTSLQGYLAYTNSTMGPRPAVIIYPDWDGISNYERWRANLLAAEGYIAFVADIYSTAVKQGPSLPAANRSVLMSEFRTNSTKFRTRVLTSLAQVRTYDLVQKDKIFAIGYCFGGGAVLELMRSWPATTGLLGVGGFHAGPLTTTGTKAQPGNPLIVQVYQGADDPGMTQDMRTAFTSELRAANMTWNFYAYGRTVHAFTLMENPLWNGNKSQSNGYNPAADRASWWALRGLLMESFGLTNMSNPYTATGGAYDYQTGINGQRLANAVAA
ncbi:g10130 [Coccomyxa viridis]|uniref:G10130 protein n=1 Tax=Coccomyxa viridis TaxID=1274662 RepID=A0ABP1G4K0_9CHLO